MRMTLKWITAGCWAALALPMAYAQTGTGAIQGTVLGPDGKPVPESAVLYSELPTQTRSGAVLAHGYVRAQTDGSFAVSSLPAGSYQLCVQAAEKGLLDPCIWSTLKPLATVAAGQTTSGIQIRMTQGAVVKLRLDDPGGNLKGRENTVPGTGLIIVVHTPSGFHQTTRLVSEDSSGKDFEMLLPTGIPLSLGILGDFFTIADDKGKNVGGAAGDLSITIPPGASGSPIKLTVAGHK